MIYKYSATSVLFVLSAPVYVQFISKNIKGQLPTPVLFTARGWHMRATTHRQFPSAGFAEKIKTSFQGSPSEKVGEFPPAALVEVYQEPGAEFARLRRLHLIIVDLRHPRRTIAKAARYLYNVSRKTYNQVITSYNCL